MGRKLFPECSSKGNVMDRARNTEKTEACIMPENGEKKSSTGRVRYTTRKNSWFIRVNFEKENVMVKENNTVKMEPSIMTDSGEIIRNMVRALFLPKMVNKFSQAISGMEGELISEPKKSFLPFFHRCLSLLLFPLEKISCFAVKKRNQ